MPKISEDEIKRLSKLARIKLNKNDIKSLQEDLGSILMYVEKLQSVSTEGVEETSQVTGLVDVWRDDTKKPQPTRSELLKNAPDQKDGYLKVKRVL
ncbi:MAG: Asp-tRNA(Asn)/Glu-tRNA(Gln) amidotransferase subunit GatC [Candidatus Saccharimonadales bacterium]